MTSRRIAIVRDIVRTLEGVTRAGGYETDIGTRVEEFLGSDVERLGSGPAGCVVELQGGTRTEAATMTRAQLDLVIHAWVRFAATRPGSRSGLDAIEPAITDVERALLVDACRGGLAIDTTMSAFRVTEDADSIGVAWVHWQVRVDYYHDHDDPRSWAGVMGGPDE